MMPIKAGATRTVCTNRRRPRGARGAPRRAVLTALLALLTLLLLASVAQAYAPGHLIWAKRIGTSTSEAGAWAVARGPDGAVAICGWRDVPPTGQMPLVAKYTAAGRKWVWTYPTAGFASAVAFDRAGNVYVVACVNPGPGGDFVVIKYSAAGVWQWTTAPYDGPGGFYDWARLIAVDKSGNVIVVGWSPHDGDEGPIISLLKYDANGAPAWPAAVRYDPLESDPDAHAVRPSDVAVDGAGDIYVSSTSTYVRDGHYVDSGLVLKFAGVDGSRLARWTYKPLGAPESTFSDIAVRGSTVVAVGATSDPLDEGAGDALVVKFDLSLQQTYRREWDVVATRASFAQAAIDGAGNVYVTGMQYVPGTRKTKVVTLKLGPKLSRALWMATYRPRSSYAQGAFIARDGAGNVFVSGMTATGGRDCILTMKYSPSGARKWLRTWSGGGAHTNPPCGMVLGAKGDIFVGGSAEAVGGFRQAVLLRYQR